MEKGAGAGLGLRVKVALVPEDSFKVEELRNLCVPVAGNLDGGGGGEIVFRVVLADQVWVGVHGVAVVVDLAVAGIELSERWHVDEVMPIAIEAGDGAVIDANQKSLEGLEGLLCD